MQIIDGKQVASQVLEEVERDIARLREQGITPGLAVVLVGEDPDSQVYYKVSPAPRRHPM